jgi:glycosyltransferase involved in cell wall biosynthesis
MRIAFAYAPELISGRPLDFGNLWASPRGMTGSESSLLIFARELARLGHKVSLFIDSPNANDFDGVRLWDLGDLEAAAPGYDVIISYIYSRFLHGIPDTVLRVNWQTCNSHDYEEQDFEDDVDLFLSPSRVHCAYMQKWTLTAHPKWRVLRLGCYADDYDLAPKVPGRCVYTSSPDRGLHLVLQEWPAIKAAVPHATLKIFYHGLSGWFARAGAVPRGAFTSIDNLEQGTRARYVAAAVGRLPGVEVVGSSSRETMRRELSEAEALLYPVSTVTFSEGFSCSTLEGCAAGALPILAACDAIGDVYAGVCPMVTAPAQKHMAAWRTLVVRALTDEGWRAERVAVAREFASKHDYRDIAKDLERMLLEGIALKEAAAAGALAPPAKLTDYALSVLAGAGATLEPATPWAPIRGRVVCPEAARERMQAAWPAIQARVPYADLRYLPGREPAGRYLGELAAAVVFALPCGEGKLADPWGTEPLQAMRCAVPVVLERRAEYGWLDDIAMTADPGAAFAATVAHVLESQPRQFQMAARGQRFGARYTEARRARVLAQLEGKADHESKAG